MGLAKPLVVATLWIAINLCGLVLWRSMPLKSRIILALATLIISGAGIAIDIYHQQKKHDEVLRAQDLQSARARP